MTTEPDGAGAGSEEEARRERAVRLHAQIDEATASGGPVPDTGDSMRERVARRMRELDSPEGDEPTGEEHTEEEPPR
jgi:hypothetical protein